MPSHGPRCGVLRRGGIGRRGGAVGPRPPAPADAAVSVGPSGLALFAVSYRATLDDGARDEAAFAVPLDFSLTEGSQLVLPLQAASLSRYESLAPGVGAYPVLRRTASVAGSATVRRGAA